MTGNSLSPRGGPDGERVSWFDVRFALMARQRCKAACRLDRVPPFPRAGSVIRTVAAVQPRTARPNKPPTSDCRHVHDENPR